MRGDFLPFYRLSIGQEEAEEVLQVLNSGWLSTGPKTRLFEEELKNFLGAPAVLCVNSCTSALHLSLVVLGIGSGDEVITTPMTFAASVNVIEHVRARPVLVDVERDTLNINPELVEKAVSSRTRAIMVVHYAGHPAELDSFHAIARANGCHIIEDAAHALSAQYRGKSIGSGENLTCFSFYATKNLTTGEGGALSGSADLIARARMLSLHGLSEHAWLRYSRSGSWRYQIVEPGFKYNMSDIQAAIGLAQLRKITDFQKRREEIVSLYNDAFKDNEALEIPTERPGIKHSWHLYVLRLHLKALRIGRDEFIDELKKRNIGTSVHFIPIHVHPYYASKYGYSPSDLPVAYEESLRVVSLPLGPWMTDQDAYDVIESVNNVAVTYRR